jgi:Serine/threonine protein kinase
MGEVYLASDISASRKAALKLLPERFTGDAERMKRFQQEARAVAGLNHPNILTVYEIGEDHFKLITCQRTDRRRNAASTFDARANAAE